MLALNVICDFSHMNNYNFSSLVNAQKLCMFMFKVTKPSSGCRNYDFCLQSNIRVMLL